MQRHRLTSHTISSEEQLREIIGVPAALVQAKVAPRLIAETRRFIEVSPLVCLATSDERGSCDVSPRGDPAGFVRILDERTLLLPERPGNKLADSLINIIANPRVALLFIIPGVVDSFRVDGHATITDDAKLLADSAVEGKAPKLGILIDIEHAFVQCGKAMLRSQIWNSECHVDRATLPTSGQIHRALNDAEFDADEYDRQRAIRYARRDGFY